MDASEIKQRFAKSAEYDAAIDKEIIVAVLSHAGPQWGQRSPDDIISALNAAGFMIVRKPYPVRDSED